MAPLDTDAIRALMVATEIPERALIEELDRDGPIWDTAGLQHDYDVEGFAAPYVVVRRKADDVRGTLMFTHNPRVYFGFSATS